MIKESKEMDNIDYSNNENHYLNEEQIRNNEIFISNDLKSNKIPKNDQNKQNAKESNPLFSGIMFNFREKVKLQFNKVNILFTCLFLLELEYCIYLIFQIISFILIDSSFDNYLIGLIFLIVYLVIMLMMFFILKAKLWCFGLLLKVLDFAVTLILYGWFVVYFGVSGFSLTYIILISLIIIQIMVHLTKQLNFIVIILLLMIIFLNSIILGLFIEKWWIQVILMLYLVLQLVIMTWEIKNIFEITKMTNPEQYFSYTLCKLISLQFKNLVCDIVQKKKIEQVVVIEKQLVVQ